MAGTSSSGGNMHKFLNTINILVLVSLFLFSTGCSKKNTELVLEEPEAAMEQSDNSSSAGSEEDDAPSSDSETASLEQPAIEVQQKVIVHVCGAVNNEGVYELEPGSRVIDAVNAAGGFLEDADESYVNLAQILEDAVKLRIPTVEETKALMTDETQQDIQDGNQMAGISGSSEADADGPDRGGKININKASETELCEIPGIGPSRARSIIAYREEHGRFGTIEDIMNVSGIKDKFFAKIKDHITI